ncbi:SRPBCC domain-containing protein [Corynebacterium sp. NPDC060344]|uniref:SRPBCC domain-containing protein n=1 Tax=Corynebacterium sp. NPDC060344 TaxID=3347101 RepID=UPI003661F7E8
MNASTPAGEVIRCNDSTILSFRRELGHPIDDVWRTLTDPARTAGWIGPWSGDPASGTIDLVMSAEGDGPPQNVTIVECDEPSSLIVETPAPAGGWRLEVRLCEGNVDASDEPSTIPRFTQPLDDPASAADIGPGWHYYLDRFEAVLDGRAVDMDWDADYYPALKDTYFTE